VNDVDRCIFLTGSPGIGKTSVLLRVVKALKDRGCNVGGMISQEARTGSTRIGFRLIDLGTGREGWLAHIHQKTGPSIGKYRVNLRDLRTIGVNAILSALRNADVIIIDEIGPMELYSSDFIDAVTRAMKSTKIIIGIIHYRARDPLIFFIKTAQKTRIVEVTSANRQRLHETVLHLITNPNTETP
jgi:nucleoside-triphosphatase